MEFSWEREAPEFHFRFLLPSFLRRLGQQQNATADQPLLDLRKDILEALMERTARIFRAVSGGKKRNIDRRLAMFQQAQQGNFTGFQQVEHVGQALLRKKQSFQDTPRRRRFRRKLPGLANRLNIRPREHHMAHLVQHIGRFHRDSFRMIFSTFSHA